MSKTLKEKYLAGEKIIQSRISMASTIEQVHQTIADTGCDVIYIDSQHGPYTEWDIARISKAAEEKGVPVLFFLSVKCRSYFKAPTSENEISFWLQQKTDSDIMRFNSKRKVRFLSAPSRSEMAKRRQYPWLRQSFIQQLMERHTHTKLNRGCFWFTTSEMSLV